MPVYLMRIWAIRSAKLFFGLRPVFGRTYQQLINSFGVSKPSSDERIAILPPRVGKNFLCRVVALIDFVVFRWKNAGIFLLRFSADENIVPEKRARARR